MEYQKMYIILFNAITDALKELENLNFGSAGKILKQAQIRAEEVYLDCCEKNGEG